MILGGRRNRPRDCCSSADKPDELASLHGLPLLAEWLPTTLALPLHSYGEVGSPVIGSSRRCYKSIVTIKSPHSVKTPQQLRQLGDIRDDALDPARPLEKRTHALQRSGHHYCRY